MFSPDKLKYYRELKSLSQTEIAKYLQVTRAAYSSWETGKRQPNNQNLQELCVILNISPQELQEEHPFMEKYHMLTPVNQQKLEDFTDDLLLKQNVIPLFSYQVLDNVELSAGPGEGYFDEYETDTVYSDIEFTGFDIAAWIHGTSMEPVYQSGEVALIRADGFDYDGAVYALSWEGSTYIKKLYREEDGFRMVSINKSVADKFIPYEDDVRVIGKVIGHFMPVEGE